MNTAFVVLWHINAPAELMSYTFERCQEVKRLLSTRAFCAHDTLGENAMLVRLRFCSSHFKEGQFLLEVGRNINQENFKCSKNVINPCPF